MCAIIDASVANTTIGDKSTEAGSKFLEFVAKGTIRLVIGGEKYRDELKECSSQFNKWLNTAVGVGLAMNIDDTLVDAKAREFTNANSCDSDDEHVVALAFVSGARLVFTNDTDLHSDCSALLKPSAKIYSTLHGRTDFDRAKERLLRESFCLRGSRI